MKEHFLTFLKIRFFNDILSLIRGRRCSGLNIQNRATTRTALAESALSDCSCLFIYLFIFATCQTSYKSICFTNNVKNEIVAFIFDHPVDRLTLPFLRGYA